MESPEKSPEQEILQLIQNKQYTQNPETYDRLQQLILEIQPSIRNHIINCPLISEDQKQKILKTFISNLSIQSFSQNQFLIQFNQKPKEVYIQLLGESIIWDRKESQELSEEIELTNKLHQAQTNLKQSQNQVEKEYFEGEIEKIERQLRKYRDETMEQMLKDTQFAKKYYVLPNVCGFKPIHYCSTGSIIGDFQAVQSKKMLQSYQIRSKTATFLKIPSDHFQKIFNHQIEKLSYLHQTLKQILPTATNFTLMDLASLCQIEQFNFCETIFHENDNSDKLYIIKSGIVSLTKLKLFQNQAQQSAKKRKTQFIEKNMDIATLENDHIFAYENLKFKKYHEKLQETPQNQTQTQEESLQNTIEHTEEENPWEIKAKKPKYNTREYKAMAIQNPKSVIFSLKIDEINDLIQLNQDNNLYNDFINLQKIKSNWLENRIKQLSEFTSDQTKKYTNRRNGIKKDIKESTNPLEIIKKEEKNQIDLQFLKSLYSNDKSGNSTGRHSQKLAFNANPTTPSHSTFLPHLHQQPQPQQQQKSQQKSQQNIDISPKKDSKFYYNYYNTQKSMTARGPETDTSSTQLLDHFQLNTDHSLSQKHLPSIQNINTDNSYHMHQKQSNSILIGSKTQPNIQEESEEEILKTQQQYYQILRKKSEETFKTPLHRHHHRHQSDQSPLKRPVKTENSPEIVVKPQIFTPQKVMQLGIKQLKKHQKIETKEQKELYNTQQISFLKNHECYKNKALQRILNIANKTGKGPKTSKANFNTDNLQLLFKNKSSNLKVKLLQTMTESQNFKLKTENKQQISQVMGASSSQPPKTTKNTENSTLKQQQQQSFIMQNEQDLNKIERMVLQRKDNINKSRQKHQKFELLCSQADTILKKYYTKMAKQTKLKQLKLKEKEQNELFPHKINEKKPSKTPDNFSYGKMMDSKKIHAKRLQSQQSMGHLPLSSIPPNKPNTQRHIGILDYPGEEIQTTSSHRYFLNSGRSQNILKTELYQKIQAKKNAINASLSCNTRKNKHNTSKSMEKSVQFF